LPHDERLAKLALPTLDLRCLHLDLIFCYQVTFGLLSVSMIFSHLAQSQQHVDINTNYISNGALAMCDKCCFFVERLM